MLASIARFTDDAAAIEKTLRLIQGICTTIVALHESTNIPGPWLRARAQVNLGRRYFRVFKWYPAFVKASVAAANSHLSAIERLLQVTKYSFLGLYFLLEASTLTNAMGVTDYTWGPAVQLEANRCWFYALVASIVLIIYHLMRLYASPASGGTTVKQSNAKKTIATAKDASLRSRLMVDLAIDCCDIVLPGTALGWIPAGQVTVGCCQSISSVLAGQRIWDRVQAKAA